MRPPEMPDVDIQPLCRAVCTHSAVAAAHDVSEGPEKSRRGVPGKKEEFRCSRTFYFTHTYTHSHIYLCSYTTHTICMFHICAHVCTAHICTHAHIYAHSHTDTHLYTCT